jgi:arylsulfatase A-like enzyme
MIEKYKRKRAGMGQNNPTYAAMVETTDRGVGRIVATLKELGIEDKTVVVLSSDNGGVGGYRELGIKGAEITSNAPLRGGKGMLYEGGIRVPMIVCWPGIVRPGTRCDTPVTSIDFYPTILEVAGASRPARQTLDGESIVPLLRRTGSLKRDAIFWHFPAYLQGAGGTWRTTPAGAIRKGNWKLLEFFEDGRLELYNLGEDLGEKNSLAVKMPEKTRLLHTLLKDWRKSVDAKVPTERNPKYEPSALL